MSEERRAAPAPNAVDVAAAGPDIDGETPPPRPGARDSSPAARRRGRMTLRIPDDEVARPLGVETVEPPPVRAELPPVRVVPRPTPSIPAPEPAVAVTPMRIISITSDLPPAPLEPEPGPVLTSNEESWLPPSAELGELGEGDDVEVVAHIQIDGAISESVPPQAIELEEPTAPILPSAPSTPRSIAPALAPPAVSSAEPIQSAEELQSADEIQPAEEIQSAEELQEGQGEEVRFEDDALTPMVPAVELAAAPDTERRSDPGEAPEISVEDMVAVEAAPSPAAAPVRLAVELPPMRSRLPSQPPLPPQAAKPHPIAPTRPPLVIVPPHVGNMGPQAAESMGPRRKARLWWEELFNDDYLRTMEKVTDAQIGKEADFIETSLGLERGGAMLDLACGTGRQAIELSRRGYEVVAFDLSLSMLARAGDEAQERDGKLNFVQGDMREMTFEAQFDGVYCWNTSFGFFDEEKNAHVVDRVHRSLKAGGLFLLDVVNRDFIVRQSPSLAWFEGDGCVCMDEMTVDFITSRMKVKRTLMLDDGRSRELEYSMRVYSLHELGKILHEHGFKVCEVSGRLATPGVYFGNESPRTIILAEKR
jgi:SAM-dependent methyltransferase